MGVVPAAFSSALRASEAESGSGWAMPPDANADVLLAQHANQRWQQANERKAFERPSITPMNDC